MREGIMNFGTPEGSSPAIIKVIGVGGGGGNAVNHMFNQKIKGVTFALCNTDNQALAKSPVPQLVQLGPNVTHGLGAGSNPDKAAEAAEESIEDIKKLLNDGTEMVFITAGMGGGTGTGAAPIIARTAKEMGILTVGIVTVPFWFEGRHKILQALKGVDEIRKNVDALMIINNERLRSIYPELTMINAFEMADSTLSVAANSIVEIITVEGEINLDFADVSTTLKDGGVAIISNGVAKGDRRLESAIDNALKSPLLNNTDIVHAKKILVNLTISRDSNFIMEEMSGMDAFMSKLSPAKVIWGYAIDDTLQEAVKVTLLASGFDVDDFTGKEAQGYVDEIDREKQIEDDNRIDRIYNGLRNIEEKRQKRRYTYLFEPADLDNDDIISMVGESPTYKRDKKTLDAISPKDAKKQKQEANTTPQDADDIRNISWEL